MRWLSALPNVGPYTTLKCLALQGFPCIYDISRLRVNPHQANFNSTEAMKADNWKQKCICSINGCPFAAGLLQQMDPVWPKKDADTRKGSHKFYNKRHSE
jgi:hypothetical protein